VFLISGVIIPLFSCSKVWGLYYQGFRPAASVLPSPFLVYIVLGPSQSALIKLIMDVTSAKQKSSRTSSASNSMPSSSIRKGGSVHRNGFVHLSWLGNLFFSYNHCNVITLPAKSAKHPKSGTSLYTDVPQHIVGAPIGACGWVLGTSRGSPSSSVQKKN
jgi:hypothetical protein